MAKSLRESGLNEIELYLAERIHEEINCSLDKAKYLVINFGYEKITFVYPKLLTLLGDKPYLLDYKDTAYNIFKKMLYEFKIQREFVFYQSVLEKEKRDKEEEEIQKIQKEQDIEDLGDIDKEDTEEYRPVLPPHQLYITKESIMKERVSDEILDLATYLKLARSMRKSDLLDYISRSIMESYYNAFLNNKLYYKNRGLETYKINTPQNQDYFIEKLKNIKQIIKKETFMFLLYNFLSVNQERYIDTFGNKDIRNKLINLWERI